MGRPRLYYGGKRPDGVPPIPPIFKTPAERSKALLKADVAYVRKRIEACRARIEDESAKLDQQEQQLMELEEEIDAYSD